MSLEALGDVEDISGPVLAPLFDRLVDENLAIAAVNVQIVFQKKKEGSWPFSGETVTPDSCSKFSFHHKEIIAEAAKMRELREACAIAKELLPLFASLKPEQIPVTLGMIFPRMRRAVEQCDNGALLAFKLLLTGEKLENIRAHIEQMDAQDLEAQALAFKQQIQDSSDLELYYLFQPFISDFQNTLEPALITLFDHDKKQQPVAECAKITQLFQKTLQEVQAKPNVVQISGVRIFVLLINPEYPTALPTGGFYTVTDKGSQGWQWTQDKQLFSSLSNTGGGV